MKCFGLGVTDQGRYVQQGWGPGNDLVSSQLGFNPAGTTTDGQSSRPCMLMMAVTLPITLFFM